MAAKIQRITRDCEKMSENIACNVAAIAGETVIRTLEVHLDAPPLQTLQPRELRARLHESGADNGILFAGCDGAFEWVFSGNGDSGAD